MIKICADSSCDLTQLDGFDYSYAPLKIIAGDREFTDDSSLDTENMLSYLEGHKGKSHTSCPNTEDWLRAFGDADEIFAVTITSNLSGSYNSAICAATSLTDERSNVKIHVIDTLSVGPESALIIKKLCELISKGLDFESVKNEICEYHKHTRLIFALESMHNLANNGRVSHVVAKMAGLLGIRAIGRASERGTLEMTDKVRGIGATAERIYKNMLTEGYNGGDVRIHHVKNSALAELLHRHISDGFPTASVTVAEAGGLCSFYAERGGILVGFEI